MREYLESSAMFAVPNAKCFTPQPPGSISSGEPGNTTSKHETSPFSGRDDNTDEKCTLLGMERYCNFQVDYIKRKVVISFRYRFR
jgi:hypothetical protein